jgi:hypothetical protein
MRAIAIALAFLPALTLAVDQGMVITNPEPNKAGQPDDRVLQPYEPITGGWTKDSDDVSYLDVTLSVKVRLLPVIPQLPRSRVFLALTTRFGFYWGTRPNSPVIGKDYNPKLLWRFLPDATPNSLGGNSGQYASYLDVAYAHESNGQIVHTLAQYKEELVTASPPEYADNFIHRGWDYPEVAWKHTFSHDIALYLDGKYFLPYGLLQGPEDQYHPWENNPQGKPRRAVDGLEAQVAWPSSNLYIPLTGGRSFSRPNLTLKYKTGYDVPFKYSTVRAELGCECAWLPIAIWAQHGYMSDLAMYYQKVTSYGIELRFESF